MVDFCELRMGGTTFVDSDRDVFARDVEARDGEFRGDLEARDGEFRRLDLSIPPMDEDGSVRFHITHTRNAGGVIDGLSVPDTEIEKIEWEYDSLEKIIGKISLVNYNNSGTGWYGTESRLQTGFDFYTSDGESGLQRALRLSPNGNVDAGRDLLLSGSLFANSSRDVFARDIEANYGDFRNLVTADHVSAWRHYALSRGDNRWDITISNSGSLILSPQQGSQYGDEARLDINPAVQFFGPYSSVGDRYFDLGQQSATWRDLHLGRDAFIGRNLRSTNYTSGIFGTGWAMDNPASGDSFFEIDNLRVRKEFRTHIFRKEEVRATNSMLYVSDASEVAEQKSLGTGSQTLVIRAGDGFATFSVGDEITIKNLAPDLSSVSTIEATVTGVNVSGEQNTLSLNVTSGGTVYEGDTIVRTSGSALLLDASTEYSPFLDALDDGDTISRFGRLTGITKSGTTLQGSGIYGTNTYLTDYLLVGDITKQGQYLEYSGNNFTIVTQSGDLDTVLDDYDDRIATNTSAVLSLDADVTDRIASATADFRTQSQITTEINNAVDGLASESYVNTAVSELATETYVTTTIASATGDFLTEAQIEDEITGAVDTATAGLALKSYVDDEIDIASATLTTRVESAEGDISAAELRLDAVEELGSTATLIADNFNFQAEIGRASCRDRV